MIHEKFNYKILILLLTTTIIKANPNQDGREMMKVLIKRQDTPVGSGTGGNTAVTPPTVVTPIPVGNTPTSPTTIPVNTPGTPTTTPTNNSPTTTSPIFPPITSPATTPQSNNQGGGGGGANTSPTTPPSQGGGAGNTSPQSPPSSQSIPLTSPTSVVSSDKSSVPTSIPSSSSTTIIVAVTTVLITLDNGSVSSSAISSTSTAVITAAAGSSGSNTNSTSSGNGKTWGIVGGVVGGLILLAALVFVTYRLTNKRFNSLDDLNLDELKWPELKADNPAASSLNPSATRRTGGSGFNMGDGIDEDEEEGGGSGGAGEGSDGLNGSHEGRSIDGATSGSVVSGRSMSANPLMGLSGGGTEHYRDEPYHPSSQPYPPSPNTYRSNSPIAYQSPQPPSPNAYSYNPNANLYSNPVGAEIYQSSPHNHYPTFQQDDYAVQDRRVSGYGYE